MNLNIFNWETYFQKIGLIANNSDRYIFYLYLCSNT